MYCLFKKTCLSQNISFLILILSCLDTLYNGLLHLISVPPVEDLPFLLTLEDNFLKIAFTPVRSECNFKNMPEAAGGFAERGMTLKFDD